MPEEKAMTISQRLQVICQMIDQRRKEDDPGNNKMSWGVENDWQATIDTDDTHVVLSWISVGRHAGEIEVEFSGNGVAGPGAVRLMYINAAMWPAGDFQVAEQIGDQL